MAGPHPRPGVPGRGGGGGLRGERPQQDAGLAKRVIQGKNLLAGVKRAANILAIEEKKDKKTYEGEPDIKLLTDKEELALAASIAEVKQDTVAAINVENFKGAMRALAELRPAVDAFFDKVTVNAPDPKLRENRLKLLSEIRAATLKVADFSKIAG